MELYAVAYNSPVCIAYFWADETDHAKEQAVNAGYDVLAIRVVPGEYDIDFENQIVIYTGVIDADV